MKTAENRLLLSEVEAAEARNRLPSLAGRVIDAWREHVDDEAGFRLALHQELSESSWEHAVQLMRVLESSDAVVAFSRSRFNTLTQRGINDVNQFIMRADAEVILSTIRLHIALNHKDGDIIRDGIERRLKYDIHAPIEPFEKFWLYAPGLDDGVTVKKKGNEAGIVHLAVCMGSVVCFSSPKSDTVAVVRAGLRLDENQIARLEDAGVGKGYAATIVRGQQTLVDELFMEQLAEFLHANKHIHTMDIPVSQFDVAVSVDEHLIAADFYDTPQWILADIDKLTE